MVDQALPRKYLEDMLSGKAKFKILISYQKKHFVQAYYKNRQERNFIS